VTNAARATRSVWITNVLAGSALIIFAVVTRSTDLFASIVYASFGVPVALLVVVGLNLGAAGRFALIAAGVLIAILAVVGGFTQWPIELPGGTLWWWALLVVALIGVAMVLIESSMSDAPGIRRTPRVREAVVGAQVMLGLGVIGLFFIALENAHGISGMFVPILFIPFAAVLTAGAAYWQGVRWPVVIVDTPLFLFAVAAGREELGSPSWQDEPAGLMALVVVAVLTAMSVVAAVIPPSSRVQVVT
jgi:hypothetical protein